MVSCFFLFISERFPYVSQNKVFGINSNSLKIQTDFNWTQIVDNWFSDTEHLSSNYTNNLQNFAETFFGRMLYSEANYIGCGAALFDDTIKYASKYGEPQYQTSFTYVCNYAPGNKRSDELFLTGEAASDCPVNYDKSLTYSSLCELKNGFSDDDFDLEDIVLY